MMSLTDIQQAFVRRYMDGNDCVLGVRIRETGDENVIFVEIAEDADIQLPSTFLELRVEVRKGDRAVLAYR
jgi:hypothetical protein